MPERLLRPGGGSFSSGGSLSSGGAAERVELERMKQELNSLRKKNEALEAEKSRLAAVRQRAEHDTRLHNDLATKIKQLYEDVKCPVCLKVPRTDRIPICSNGHITCEDCKRSRCPVCRAELVPNMYSQFALRITELLEYRCRNQGAGCQVALLKQDLLRHELACNYTEKVQCPGGCRAVARFHVQHHITTCRGIQANRFQVGKPVCVTLTCGTFSSLIKTQMYKPEGESGQADRFFLVGTKVEEQAVFLVKLLSEDRTRKYAVAIEVSNKAETYSRSCLGETVQVDVDVEKAVEEGNTLELSPKVMERICGRNTTTVYRNFEVVVKFNVIKKITQ